MRTLLHRIRYWKSYDFERVFGFVPKGNRLGLGPVAVAEQAMVDKKLEQLAVGYRLACHDEETSASLLRSAGASGDPKKFLSARDNLDFNRSEVKRTKGTFWYAHGLAEREGFKVKQKSGDYFPSPWR